MSLETDTPHRLQRIRLKRISLVDDPANQHSQVVLFKRAEDAAPVDPDETSLVELECGNCGAPLTKAEMKRGACSCGWQIPARSKRL
jgi:hypothetical protein